MRFPIMALYVALISATPAIAASPFPPTHDKICNRSEADGISHVDRAKLADYVLAKYPLSIRAIPKDAVIGDVDTGVYVLGRIESICVTAKDCSASDFANASEIRGALLQFLLATNQTDNYIKPAHLTPASYFLPAPGQQTDIQCIYAGGRPADPPGAALDEPAAITSPIRIRGKVDDLYIDRSENDFKTSSQATVSFASDSIAGKSTETLQGVIGYAIPTKWLKEMGEYAVVIPYLQVNHTVTEPKNGSAVTPTKTDTYSVGATTSFYFRTGDPTHVTGHFINIRPDYLVNRVDKSAIASLNFQYVPIVNARINSFIDGYSPFLYKWIFDIRVSSGTYTDRGLPTVSAKNKDFLRAGGQFGFAAVTRSDQLPLSFTSTYTYLPALRGDIDVGYFSNAVTYYFDPKKYLGLTVTYTNGRREDTVKREQQLSAGLSSRF